MRIPLPSRFRFLAGAVAAEGGTAYLVGGSVRDRVMYELGFSLPLSKDVDVEVHGLPAAHVEMLLKRFGYVTRVGASFGVFRVAFDDGETFDVSIARRESKSAPGHRGVIPDFDPSINLREAAARRDYTVNSMYADAEGYVIDHFGGIIDCSERCLRHTSPAFMDDPLRVLRGMQLASRFNMMMDPATAAMCRLLRSEFYTLSAERKWDQWKAWALGPYPTAGLGILLATEWIREFPELAALQGVPQDPGWHPEGDVWRHTVLTSAQVPRIARRENLDADARLVFCMASMLHDVGKATHTFRVGDEISSYGHAGAGEPITRDFLNKMRAPSAVVSAVGALVREHMIHASADPAPRTVRRLALRLASAGTNIKMLALVCEADASGRTLGPRSPMEKWVEVAETIGNMETGPEPILKGRHLIELGLEPGPEFKPLLQQAFQAQLDGDFSDAAGGIEWLLNSRFGTGTGVE